MARTKVSVDEVVRLTREIENCSGPGELEGEVLPLVADALCSEAACVFVYRPRQGGSLELGASYNLKGRDVSDYFSTYRYFDPVQLKIESDVAKGSAAVVSIEDVVSLPEFQRTRYYQEFLRPLGVYRYLCSGWSTRNDLVIQLGVQRLSFTPPFTPSEHSLSRALVPAVARVFEHSFSTSREQILRSVCASLCELINERAPIVLESGGAIAYAEARASELLGLNVASRAMAVRATLRRMIRGIRSELDAVAPRPVSVSLRSATGTPLEGRVRRLPSGDESLYLLTLEKCGSQVEHLSSRLGLSPRAAQIVDLIAAGCTNHQIAERLGLSTNTVRNHIAGIYERLGIRNRVELLLRITSASAPR
jgi:DNA-binding CsgD family transcriptional regulator